LTEDFGKQKSTSAATARSENRLIAFIKVERKCLPQISYYVTFRFTFARRKNFCDFLAKYEREKERERERKVMYSVSKRIIKIKTDGVNENKNMETRMENVSERGSNFFAEE